MNYNVSITHTMVLRTDMSAAEIKTAILRQGLQNPVAEMDSLKDADILTESMAVNVTLKEIAGQRQRNTGDVTGKIDKH